MAMVFRVVLFGKLLIVFDASCHIGFLFGLVLVVEWVVLYGKYIEIGFDDGVVFYIYLCMIGLWYLYWMGEYWCWLVN